MGRMNCKYTFTAWVSLGLLRGSLLLRRWSGLGGKRLAVTTSVEIDVRDETR